MPNSSNFLLKQHGDLVVDDLGMSPRLRLLNGFFFGDPTGKFTTLCKQPVGLPPTT